MSLPTNLPALVWELERRREQRAVWKREWQALAPSEHGNLTEAVQLWAHREANLPFGIIGLPDALQENAHALIGGGVLDLRVGGILPKVALRRDLWLPLYAETDHFELGVFGSFVRHSRGRDAAGILQLYQELKSMDHSWLFHEHVSEALRDLPTSQWIAWSETNRPCFADLRTLGDVRKRLCKLLVLCQEEDAVSAVLGFYPGAWSHRPLPDPVDLWQIAKSQDPGEIYRLLRHLPSTTAFSRGGAA